MVTTQTTEPIQWLEGLDPDTRSLLSSTGQHIADRIDRLPKLIQSYERVLIVIDRIAVRASAQMDHIDRLLSGLEHVEYFEAFSPNPTSEQAAEAGRCAARCGAQCVLAVGGGSCLDVAKIAALSANRPEAIEALSRGEASVEAGVLPLVAVPTTSGTGSEATHFAAIYVDGRKVSIAHPALRPGGVVLDVRMHRAMPPQLAAVTGCDALGQSMESLWAVGRSDRSAAYARAGGRLVADNLARSVSDADPDARTAVMLGAHLAGQAINLSKTTAAHAMSYAITQRLGLAHGHAVALTLGRLGQRNAALGEDDCQDPRGDEAVRDHVREAASLVGAEPEQLPDAIAGLLTTIGLEHSAKALGIDASTRRALAEMVDPVRSGNNPRRLSTDDLTELLAH